MQLINNFKGNWQSELLIKTSKINHLYAFISQVNQKIVRVTDEETLFRNACQIALEFGKFKMAWIGMFDIENKKINLVEQSGIPPEEIKLFTNASYQAKGPQYYVLQTGTYYICHDIEKELELESWKPFAAKQGIGSCIVLPIRKKGRIIGTFNLYASELNFAEKEEIDLLIEVTGDISFALDLFEKEKKHKEIEVMLANNEKQFRHTLNKMLEEIQIIDFNWQYIYVNDALVKNSTYSREELLGYTLMEKYPGIEQTDLFKVLNRCMKERTAEQLETEFVFPNGTKADFEISIQPIPEGIYILSVDRTGQKKAKEKLMKVNRLYAFLSSINQSIVHLSNEQELLDNACNIAKDVGQFKIARIDLLDETGMLNLVSVGGSQTVAKVVQQYTGLDYNSTELRNNLTGKVLSTGKYAVSNDVQNDPVMSPWKKELVQNGIKASISLPIIKFGKLVGVFGFHSDTENFFDEAEIALLEEATHDISFALENFEKAKKHSQTEELVLKNEKRFRALIEKSVDMKTLTDSNGMLIYGSPSVTKVLGYSNEEFINQPAARFFHPDDIPDLIANRNNLLQSPGQSFYFQYRLLHKEGHWIWCAGSLTNMFHEPGINALVSNFRDISKRKIAELARVESEDLIQAIYIASFDAVIIIDEQGIITKWDTKSETLFGWKEKEVAGMKLSQTIIPERYREMHNKGMIHYSETGEGPVLGKTIDLSAINKNGTEFDVSLSITPSQINGRTHFIGFIRDISEKKLAEQQREFDKNNLKALINNTPDLMWSVDRDFKLITSNESFDEIVRGMFGKSLELGGNVLDAVFSREQPTRYKTYYRRAFAGESFTEIEHTDSPFEIWSEISFYPIRKGEEVIGTACHSHDITKRKKLEKNRLQTEKRLKEAQSIAHLGSWETNMITGVSLWSEEHCSIYGLSPEENEQTEAIWVSFVHPDDLDYVIEATEEKWLTLSDTILNYRIVLNDGTVKHIYSKSKFEFNESGKPVGLYGIALDETEIKEKEQLLQKSEVFNRGVLNALSSHIAVVDSTGTLIAVNEAWKRYAVENGDATLEHTGVGSNYFKVCEKSAKVGNQTAVEVMQGMKEVMEEKKKLFYLEYPCHSPTKQEWFAIRVLKFESDEPMLVVSHQDITLRKLAEQELIFKNEELQKTNEELDRFVYSASHDLRSPLTSVLGLVSLIEAETIEDNILKYAEMIKTSIHRLDGFIKSILSYSRNNRTELEAEKIPLQKTVNEIVNSLRNMKEAEGIYFEVDMEEQQPFFSSEQRFITIMENIISNAIKYHKQDITGRYIKITGKSDQDSLHLQIEDNGIGIAAEHHNKIFDMFYRLPNKAAGSGIGLYIVKGIIEKMNGTIQVSSQEGKGTHFDIVLKNLQPSVGV